MVIEYKKRQPIACLQTKMRPAPTKPGQSRQKYFVFECLKGLYQPSPIPSVWDTQLYHPLGMGLGDKNPSNTQKTIKYF